MFSMYILYSIEQNLLYSIILLLTDYQCIYRIFQVQVLQSQITVYISLNS